MRTNDLDGQETLFAPNLPCGRTSPAHTPAAGPKERISRQSLRRSSGLKNHTLMLLDLRPGAGNMLGSYWEYDPVWLGPPGTLNTSECPKGAVESSLSLILLDTVPLKYYLTRRASLGILRRAKERGKPLPPELETALMLQAGLCPPQSEMGWDLPLALHISRREGTIDLGETAGALMAAADLQMRPFTACFSAGAGAKAGSIGYSEGIAPTLKGSAGGNCMPSVLCLNDQGGSVMEWGEEAPGPLRAQEHRHQPLVFENHGVDARYTGPHAVASTMSARYGTGGNNTPLVSSVFSRKRADRFQADSIASTQSARQYKDATDLVCRPGDGPAVLLIRRLVPTECERLQGFPDGWTDLPGASDSARYKALGNSVAVPCVEYLMQGLALALRAS